MSIKQITLLNSNTILKTTQNNIVYLQVSLLFVINMLHIY